MVIFDVDTQYDFMDPKGALYVPGAETLAPTIRKIMYAAIFSGTKIISTVDAHDGSEPELNANGGPFPNHCMVNTYGQEKISESLAYGSSYVTVIKPKIESNLDNLRQNYHQIILEKKCYDIFDDNLGNPNTRMIVKELEVHNFYIIGVATDYCVKAAVLGLLKRKISTYVVLDAIKGLDKSTDAINEMANAGAKLIMSKDIRY